MHDISYSAQNYLSVDVALENILAAINALGAERVPVHQVSGRVLADDQHAPLDLPPFTNSAVDGFAVRSADSLGAGPGKPVALEIVGEVRAGETPSGPLLPGTAVKIMTGAPVPDGCDAAVRIEDVAVSDGFVSIPAPVPSGESIRWAGRDIRVGAIVFEKGRVLRPSDVAVLAALGCAEVDVIRRPRVAILATGDELVPIDQTPGPGQIRNSNEAAVSALVERYGGVPIPLGVARDTRESVENKIQEGLDKAADLFITSAGVSMGEFDVVRDVLASLGEMAFWKVIMKPGKPLTFGHVHGVPWLALPGNPVSCVVSFEVFARPALLKMAGHTRLEKPSVMALVDEAVTNDGRRQYMRGVVRREGDGYRVSVRGSGPDVQGSGMLSSLVWSNGLVVIHETVDLLPAGSPVVVHMLDWPESVF